jgi:hypothetical protein
MRLGLRDAAATFLLAAILVPYFGYVTRGSMPFVEDPRGMSGVGLILGIAAFLLLVENGLGSIGLRRFAVAAVPAALALGLVALAIESEYVLAAFVAAIIAIWAVIELARLTGVTTTRGGTRVAT